MGDTVPVAWVFLAGTASQRGPGNGRRSLGGSAGPGAQEDVVVELEALLCQAGRQERAPQGSKECLLVVACGGRGPGQEAGEVTTQGRDVRGPLVECPGSSRHWWLDRAGWHERLLVPSPCAMR